jgi:hypothetical protein
MKRLNLVADSLLFGDRMEWGKVSKVVRLEVRHVWTCLLCALLHKRRHGGRNTKSREVCRSLAKEPLSFLVAAVKECRPKQTPCFKPSCFWRGRRER